MSKMFGMKPEFENRTTIPTSSLAPLVEWARDYVGGNAKVAGLLIRYKKNAGHWIEGRATNMAASQGSRSNGFKQGFPFVLIYIGPFWQLAKYPISQVYKKRAGKIVYDNWKEMLIVFLLHEFRHIEQYRMRREVFDESGREALQHWDATFGSREVDAERFAMKGLEDFKRSPLAMEKISNERTKQMKVCPKCGTDYDIAVGFGFRRVNGKMIPQSYCYACRRAHR